MYASRWLSRSFLTWILWCFLLGIFVPPLFHLAAREFDPYKLAFQTARQSPEFKDALGSPVKEGWFFDSEIQLGDRATAKMLIPVRGSIRTGNLRAQAVKDYGRWRLTELTLELTKPNQSIDLLAHKSI
jgi:Cytochrome oxidase complex assembly protein 1